MRVLLDATELTEKENAHTYLKEMLSLPDYYGNNLDALYDCLTELSDAEIVIMKAQAAKGTYFDKVARVFNDAADDNKNLQVEMVDIIQENGDDFERLVACMERAYRGEELTIGFLGGSITQGARATEPTKCYAYRCYEWWVKAFPKAEIHYVNGGIGGTCSYFGIARAKQDVLCYQPDVVVVDFSVNDPIEGDEVDETVPDTYEGLMRKLLTWTSKPAVLALYNVFYDTGVTVEPVHRRICEYYGIPGAGMKETIYKCIKQGAFSRESISQDGLHPNDAGHEMVAAELCKIFEAAKRIAMLNVEQGYYTQPDEMYELPAPITKNRYENAMLHTISNTQPQLLGFRADASEKSGHLDCFKNGWIGKKVGDRIVFELPFESLAVQYRKTIQKPSPIAKLTIDGDSESAIILDGNFTEDWGDCLYLERVIRSEEKKMRTVEIEIIESSDEDKNPFYLLSIITA